MLSQLTPGAPFSGERFSGKEGFVSAKNQSSEECLVCYCVGYYSFFCSAVCAYGVASEQGSLVAGPSPFVLIARLHALPDAADQVVALSRAVDAQVERGRAGHVAAHL